MISETNRDGESLEVLEIETEIAKKEYKSREKQPRERVHTSQTGPEEDKTARLKRVRTSATTSQQIAVVFDGPTVLPHIEWRRERKRVVLHSDRGSTVFGGER